MEKRTSSSKNGLMDFEGFSDQNPVKRWLRLTFFIRPVIRLFKGYVLDIGCGPGIYLEQYAGPSLGIDAHPNNIRICEKKGIHAIEADAHSFVQENTFDTVLISHVLEHLDNPAGAIENAYRNTKHGGRIIVIVPFYEGFVSGLNHRVGHKQFITEEYLDREMNRLSCIKVSSSAFPPFYGGKYKELRAVYEK